MDNHLYNLMTQMTTEQKSLWRIKKHYLDETNSEEEKVFWKNLINDKENHIKEIKELIKSILT